MMADLISSHVLIFVVGLGIGLGVGFVFWRRSSRKYENYLQRAEFSQEKKVEQYQSTLQRIKEREAKIGELRKEIYHKDQLLRELNRRLEGHPRRAPAQNQSRARLIY